MPLFLSVPKPPAYIGEGAEKAGGDACTPGGMDQFNHNICSFAARLQTFALETDIVNQDQLFTVRIGYDIYIPVFTGISFVSFLLFP